MVTLYESSLLVFLEKNSTFALGRYTTSFSGKCHEVTHWKDYEKQAPPTVNMSYLNPNP